MILFLPAALITFLILRGALARVLPFVFGLVLASAKGVALAAAAGAVTGLIASYGTLEPATVGLSVGLVALPFTLGFAWRAWRDETDDPRPRSYPKRPTTARAPQPPEAIRVDPVWRRARELAGRHARPLDEAERRVTRFWSIPRASRSTPTCWITGR